MKPSDPPTTAYSVCLDYFAGMMTAEELVDVLSKWEFNPSSPVPTATEAGNDASGSFDGIGAAVADELIDLDLYRRIARGNVHHLAAATGADVRYELSLADTGTWRVTTIGSVQLLDLDHRTWTRLPGPHSTSMMDNGPRKLRSIESCRTRESGRWTLFTTHPLLEFTWHRTSTIESIERDTGDDREA